MSVLLRHSADSFSVLEHRYAQYLSEQMVMTTGRRPSPGERHSWERSIPTLVSDLRSAGLGKVEMMVEYQLPLTSKRADVILAGVHPKTGKDTYVVVELKQWTDATRFEDDDVLIRIGAYGDRPVSHPIVQVRDYCDYLAGFNAVAAASPESVHGVAYLHNATDYQVADLFQMQPFGTGHLFTGQRRGEFQRWLTTVLSPESGAAAADRLMGARISPSKQLLDVAAAEIQHREQFVLLDEQRDAYNSVLFAIDRARKSNLKTAIVVSGGPGSGKSVIALSLLGELARQGRTVVHATGSRSFTMTLRKVAGRRAPQVRGLFKYFNSFIDAQPNDLDCLILDEAHRVRETSVNRYTKAALRTGRPQLDELVDTARVPVFLLDQNQVVRPGELGTVGDITAFARGKGLDVIEIDLNAQFRCGGSELFVSWVERLLGLVEDGPFRWEGDGNFELLVADSPAEMEAYLQSKLAAGYGARMAAGFCWPWSDPRGDGTLVPDVRIGGWERPWNLKGDRSVGGAPPSALWANDPAGFSQVGCIYTAQGFEYDFAGVIIGPDLVRRGDRWFSVRAGTRDPELMSAKKVSPEQFDRLVRNVYKVLLTRGMQGVILHSTDPETMAYLKTVC